jgi:hypothetical protein
MGWAEALLVAVAPRSCGAQVLAEKALQGVSEGRPQAAKSSLSIADLMARNLMASEEEGRSRLTPPEGPLLAQDSTIVRSWPQRWTVRSDYKGDGSNNILLWVGYAP